MSKFKKFEIKHSTKNIPNASEEEYKQALIQKTQHLVRRMRWKAKFFEEEEEVSAEDHDNYGFKTTRTPKPIQHLQAFEEDLINIVQNVEFRKTKTKFQTELSEIVRNIGKCKNLIVPSDKTSNFYEISVSEYRKLLINNITKDYEKCNDSTLNEINLEAKNLTKKQRIKKLPLKNAYITVKDHKENFLTHPKCRLINPTKSDVGRIVKVRIDCINKAVRLKSKLMQWTDTDQVLNWFTGLEKQTYSFFKFDVVDFYPSISEELVTKSLKFASKYTVVSTEDLSLIKNACKSVLYEQGNLWRKKRVNNISSLFDVAQGSFMGAELCELVGLFLLDGLKNIFGLERVGLYRDDGLAVLPNSSGFKVERLKKQTHAFFKSRGLRVTVESPMLTTDFLDVKLNLSDLSYMPYKKKNAKIMYINKCSSHPKNIIKQIPNIINQRLNKRSSNEENFLKTKKDYELIMKKCGYNDKLNFEKTEQKTKTINKNKRKRKVIWYNPPFCSSVKTNIGREFINLVKKHFNKNNPLSKIFNKHNMRVSYSCMANLERLIKSHNQKILNKSNSIQDQCNCVGGCKYDLKGGNCRSENIIYKATVNSDLEKKFYIGLCSTQFRFRYANHKKSFKGGVYENETELSKYVCGLKRKNIDFKITWEVLKRAQPIADGNNPVCRLCLKESTAVVYALKKEGCLNKRSEFISSCRHMKKLLLKQIKF